MLSKTHHKAGNKYDEYYTTYEEVEWIFNNLTIPVKDKIIYCFCDNEESAFVKYLKNHTELGYKELIYTWDDYNTHLDLFDKADIYITNPPFSKIIKEIIPILNDRPDKDYFLFGSFANIVRYRKLLSNKYIYRRNNFVFNTPHINKNGTYQTVVQYTCYITTIKQSYYDKPIIKREYKDRIYWKSNDNREGLMIDRLNRIPDDYYDYMLTPITILLDPIIEKYDIYWNDRSFSYKCNDDKKRYIRVLVKRKLIE